MQRSYRNLLSVNKYTSYILFIAVATVLIVIGNETSSTSSTFGTVLFVLVSLCISALSLLPYWIASWADKKGYYKASIIVSLVPLILLFSLVIYFVLIATVISLL